jgi:hypothetical protein
MPMSTARYARSLFAGVALACAFIAPATASAGIAEGDALRISTTGQRSLKWTWTPPGHQDRYGHSEGLMHAPMATVIQRVLDYGKYKELAPWRFTASRVVGHEKGTDLYMEFSVLHGLVKLWDVSRFNERSGGEGIHVVEGKFLRGNVKDSNIIWTVERVDDDYTVLKCDILLKPDLPVSPAQSAIDEELRDAAQQAVDGVQRKAQGDDKVATWTPPHGP